MNISIDDPERDLSPPVDTMEGRGSKDARSADARKEDSSFARNVHEINRDLFVHSSRIYWADFSFSMVVAYTSLLISLRSPGFSIQQIAAIVFSGFAFYRGSIFTHELVHMPPGSFRGFRFAWNLLIGIPLMTPTFMYGDHKSHHVNHSYGTRTDGEYFPLGLGPFGLVFVYLAHIVFVPAAALSRFVLLAPISLLHPRLRRFVCERFSSIATMNPRYRRPLPDGKEIVSWRLQEAGCCLSGWIVIALTTLHVISLKGWMCVYSVFVVVSTLNYLRQLGAHRYLNEGEEMSYSEQMLDSTTIAGNPIIGELCAPLGMRYHALHHLLPSLPYHAMGTAHRRLMVQLPEDSPYRETIRSSLWAAIWDVFRHARRLRS